MRVLRLLLTLAVICAMLPVAASGARLPGVGAHGYAPAHSAAFHYATGDVEAARGDMMGVTLDAAATLVPGIPAVGAATNMMQRTGRKIIDAAGAGRAANRGVCSFQADTLVLTDGGLLPIRDVNTNMSVWSRNPANGDMAWQAVQAQYSNPYDETVSVTMRDVETGVEQTIVSNQIHPYFVQTTRAVANSSEGHVYGGPLANGHWVDATDLQAGDRLLNDDGTWAEVVSVEIAAEPLTAFNLTVAEFHTYFVAANQNAAPVWVHNDCFDAHFASRNAALRGAKENAGIPRSQQPTYTYTEFLKDPATGQNQLDVTGQPITTRNYVYDHPQHGQVVIKEHSVGHPAFEGHPAGQPHFNIEQYHGVGANGAHQTSSISNVSGHYTFD